MKKIINQNSFESGEINPKWGDGGRHNANSSGTYLGQAWEMLEGKKE